MKVSLFQVILIAVFGLGAVIGIVTFAAYKGSSSEAEAIGSVVVWGTIPASEFYNAKNEMAKKDASFENLSYVEKNPETVAAELATAIATGASPDMVIISNEEVLGLRGFTTPISSTILSPTAYASTFIDEAKLLTLSDGSGYYGMPFLVDPLVLFWNNDILSSEGIAKPPDTWEAFAGLVPTLAILTPTKQITRGLIGFGTYDNVQNARGILSALFLQTRAPISTFMSYGSYAASFSAAGTSDTRSGEAVLGFYTQFANPSKVAYTWNNSLPNSRQAFQTGDTALYIGYAAEARTLRALNPNLNFNVAPLPQPATAAAKVTYGTLYSMMISRGAKNPAGALKMATLLVRPEEQKIIAEATGFAPVSRTALTAPPPDPLGGVAYASALYSKGWLSPGAQGVDSVFSSMINSVITGQLQPGAAISRATGALSLLLQQ